MELKVTTLDGEAAGSVTLSDEFSGSSRARISSSATSSGSSPSASAARTT